jgi:hypothetical protein
MATTDREKINYAKAYLRRTKSVDALKALADELYASATDTITLTSGAFEGGSHSGQITFEKVLLGIAIEELLAELDPDYQVPPWYADGSVIQLGS